MQEEAPLFDAALTCRHCSIAVDGFIIITDFFWL